MGNPTELGTAIEHPSDTLTWTPAANSIDANTLVSGRMNLVPTAPPNVAAGDELVESFTSELGSTGKNIFGQSFSWLGNTWSNSTGGSIAIAAGAAGIGVAIWLMSRSSSTAKKEDPTSITSAKTATEARAAVESDLTSTSKMLSGLGYKKDDIQAESNTILLERGTDLALVAQKYGAKSHLILNSPGTTSTVIGQTSPTAYQSLRKLNASQYLDTIYHEPTNQDILQNSALIHQKTIQQK